MQCYWKRKNHNKRGHFVFENYPTDKLLQNLLGKNSGMTILIKRSIFMAVVKEQIRQIISENNISSAANVYYLLK